MAGSRRKYKDQAERQRAYLARKREKEDLIAEHADEVATIKKLNLSGFSEVASGVLAQTWLEEVQIHRSWLRTLEQSDVLPGETLRQLAKRTWDSLLASKKLSVITDGGGKWIGSEWADGSDVWYPLFSLDTQTFQRSLNLERYPTAPFGQIVFDGAKPEWFDTNWTAPSDCTGDEPIDTEKLPDLPPMSSASPRQLA
jgi:hypothetical protein